MLKQSFVIAGLCAAVMGVTGCAKTEYRKEQFQASAQAVGSRYLPAKVDILIVPDNTGSINNIFSTLQSQLGGFVASLQNKYWDYHIGRSPIIPMIAPPRVNRVLVNPKFNVPQLSDGTPVDPTGLVPADRAETNPFNFPILQNVNQTGQGDDTYQVILDTLVNSTADTYTRFMRQDALLAVIVVTNGYDKTVTNNQGAYITGGSARLQSVASQLAGYKGSASLVRFYPVAAYAYHDPNQGSGSCLTASGTSLPGHSYHNLLGLGSIGGASFDVCDSNSLSNVLANIEANLEIVRQDYIYSNIVLDEEPVPGSIQVFKNGNSIPQGSVNGWEYKGFGTVATVTGICDSKNKSNVDTTGVCNGTIVPASLSKRTGYIVKLNGSARMAGRDTPDVLYDKQ